jgi:hypothetical protein
MALNIQVCGEKTRLMEWVFTSGMTGGSTTGNGLTTTCMGTVFIFTQTESGMMGSLRMIRSVGLANTTGPMAVSTMATGSKESSMELERTLILTKAQ